jgi:hypothetical protein
MGAFDDIQDQEDAEDVELSENIAEDYIKYHRGNVVGHEQEGLLMYLSLLTGWAYDDGCHNNVIGQGPPGSGKSLTKNTVEALLDDADTYTKTSASSNAILDSQKWDFALVAPMDEYDKIDRDIIEVLKSSNPEDGGYAKDRNVEDPDARGGYSPTEVSADANPWVLLYAPSSKKGGIDNELEDRALILYFSNDKHTRRGIMRKEFGHENIDTNEYDDEYIYDTQALAAALRQHVRELPVRENWETDDGDEYLESRRGDTLIYMPLWVAYTVEPIFNIDEDYTNRVFGLVNNLIRASALANHENRDTKQVDIYVDEDSTETQQREAVVVEPQDVANVLSCLPTLLSTTHQLTPLKRRILDAVDATEPMTDADGTTVQDVRDWLDDNDIPHPTEGTLRNKMDELAENYYLQMWENAAGKHGTATAYERRDEGALQAPNVYGLQEYANKDGINLSDEDGVSIDTENPFEGVRDPIRDQPFIETVAEFEENFSGDSVEDDHEDFTTSQAMGGGSDDSPSESDDSSDTQASLTDVSESSDSATQSRLPTDDSSHESSEDGVSGPSDDSSTDGSVDLDPDGEPETPTEAYVLDAMQASDGEVFGSQHDVTHYMGLVPTDQTSVEADLSGTVVSPEHDLWQNRPDLKDDRVVTEADALQELTDAYSNLRNKGLVVEDDDSGPPAMFVLRTAKLDT